MKKYRISIPASPASPYHCTYEGNIEELRNWAAKLSKTTRIYQNNLENFRVGDIFECVDGSLLTVSEDERANIYQEIKSVFEREIKKCQLADCVSAVKYLERQVKHLSKELKKKKQQLKEIKKKYICEKY